MEKRNTTAKLAVIRKAIAHNLTMPLVKLLARTSVTPSTITWLGFLLTVVAAVLIGTGNLIAAGVLVLVAGYFDIIDGALARSTNQVTIFGGVLDSTLDRMSEAATLIGIMAFFLFTGESAWMVLLAAVALISSVLVSYIRSRAETLNIDCQVGIFTRTERVVILSLGLISNQVIGIEVVLMIITLLSVVTVIQRLHFTYQQAKLISGKKK